jgi:hypothetical protein
MLAKMPTVVLGAEHNEALAKKYRHRIRRPI